MYTYTYTYMYMYMCMCIYIYTCICMSVYVNIFIGSLDRKLRNYRWLSWLAFPPSCQPDHHVSHLIVSTTNYQVGGKRNSSEACKFTGESTPWHENPAFFLGNVGSWGHRSIIGSPFPRFRASIWESYRKKVHRTVIRSFVLSLVHGLVDSLVQWLIDSLIHCLIAPVVDSLINSFICSLIRFMDSLIH